MLAEFATALRAAADQLEAVHRLSDSLKREGVAPDFWIELNRAIRTVDAAPQAHHPACGALDEPCHCAERGDAPQEDRDECGVVTEGPAPTYCTKVHGHDGDHNTGGVV